jgi:16S rRNA (cytosine1402-N4)-methyltransferase
MHETVLLKEAVDALVVDPAGCYVDGTFGRGGHCREILSRLSPEGRLMGIDKDPQALAVGRELMAEDSRFTVVQGSFADCAALASAQGMPQLDGVLLDLGVSSPQLDQAERGFSFLRDGYLDMRMNPEAGLSAAEWLAQVSESELIRVLKEYGEERYAKRIAKAILAAQKEQPIETTLRLAKIIAEAHPNWERGKNPATKSFQGIRIFINNELGDLEQFLASSLDMLKPGGRLAIISFHSLEDRMVKRFFKRQAKGDDLPPGVPVLESQLNRRMKLVGKAIRAGDEEVNNNIRSRSAIMRVAEKLA